MNVINLIYKAGINCLSESEKADNYRDKLECFEIAIESETINSGRLFNYKSNLSQYLTLEYFIGGRSALAGQGQVNH